jgi:hypothetical protein
MFPVPNVRMTRPVSPNGFGDVSGAQFLPYRRTGTAAGENQAARLRTHVHIDIGQT